MTRLYEFYNSTVKSEMIKMFDYKSVMEVPRIQKVTINMGVGEATADKKILENALSDLEKITGQKPFTTRAKKSIATFKVRMGYPIGCMVTMRGKRMFEFLDRLINVAIPRIRDFRGISGKGFDGRGNYN
ncbi:MAG: 50S ribosomal protein L5, partial [Nitrosomonas sp.]